MTDSFLLLRDAMGNYMIFGLPFAIAITAYIHAFFPDYKKLSPMHKIFNFGKDWVCFPLVAIELMFGLLDGEEENE
jgi:hypothetical protein